jgi:hypothetical protein
MPYPATPTLSRAGGHCTVTLALVAPVTLIWRTGLGA